MIVVKTITLDRGGFMPSQNTKAASEMEILMDPDVKRVLEFMESTIAADKLLKVAGAVNE